jgi:hypothetical protein
MMWFLSVVGLLAAAAEEKPAPVSGMAPPVTVLAADKPIDVDIGHAAPCLADLLGEGKPQLLVGQFGDGKLRVYRNVGTAKEPKFKDFEWFKAGGDVGKVPSG